MRILKARECSSIFGMCGDGIDHNTCPALRNDRTAWIIIFEDQYAVVGERCGHDHQRLR